MAPHFRWFLKLLFLLQMLARAPTIDTRPASGAPQSELIAGNEFLKLFLERDELQRDLHSGEYQQGRKASGSGSDVAGDADADGDRSAGHFDNSDANEANGQAVGRATAMAARSVGPKSRNGKRNANADDDGKPVVKLVTSGSKIVFLEEYDDNDAVVDAVAREIDLQKENVRKAVAKSPSELQKQRQQQQQLQQKSHKTNPGDEVKVVAVSVSSSSKRTNARVARKQGNKLSPMSTHAGQASAHADIMRQAHKTAPQPHDSSTASTFRASAVPKEQLTLTTAAPTTTTRGDFVNRSHKSEFSIEEAEPLTMSQRQAARAMSAAFVDALDEVDSENSASTNIHNVLAAPLVQSASTRSTATMAVAYHSGNQNASTSLHINHSPSGVHAHVSTHDTSAQAADASVSAPAGEVDDEKLLPFQTVIYHDTKEGRGPQSRSISYSSLSQNVDDLHRWRQSGILAEAQRNVSESLKPAEHSAVAAHNSEPAKFYSVPSKMYGEPAKFYSEPAKVYSEPAKVYGQPEKFYSEPAKVYSQPSKFYSEPAKVYSQPAKVYGEPAKTYWPHAAAAATTSNTSSTTTTTTTTAAPSVKAPAYAARRPAVVSRIAFGEAQSSTAAPTNTDNEPQMPSPTAAHYQPHRQYGHSHAQSHTLTNPSTSSQSQSQPQTQIQSRRVLFNLDKLPYDLLNAPAQSSKHLLDPDLPSSPPAAVTYSSPRQRQCLESAFSASLSQSATQHQQLLQQQRQHSSLSDQHSNQNAKGLPNRDLVKCVSKYSQLAAPAAPHTTESSHIDELYTPTPEQNYEIEESVSVMTNGRAHGVQGIHGPTTATPATKPAAGRPAKMPTRMRFGGAGGRLHHYNANANANVNADASLHEAGRPADHSYDDGDEGSEDVGDGFAEGAVDVDAGDGDDADAAAGNKSNHGGNGNGGDDDDDSKVAYVVEGRNYRKYRVEEKTDDGFIVGEYGVVDHNDGNLRGVRYTADSTINRSLIQKALLTFLKLK